MNDSIEVDLVGKPCVMIVTDPDFDLSTVLAASFTVLKPVPGGVEATWPATLSYNADALKLTVCHVFQPGDLNVPGTYVIFANLVTAEGTFRTRSRTFVVKRKN